MSFKKFLVIPAVVAILGFSFGTANAQVVQPRVAVQLASTGLTNPLVASSTNSTLARLVLDTTGSSEPINLSTIPLTLTAGNGALAGSLQNCVVVNEATGGALSVSSSATTLNSGINNFTLSTPITLPVNTVTSLAVRCDVGPSLITGGTYTFSLNTANVAGTGTITGLPAIVSVLGATPVPPVVIPPVVIPTVPNTGAGGEAPMNYAIILGSIVVAGFGLAYARRATR